MLFRSDPLFLQLPADVLNMNINAPMGGTNRRREVKSPRIAHFTAPPSPVGDVQLEVHRRGQFMFRVQFHTAFVGHNDALCLDFTRDQLDARTGSAQLPPQIAPAFRMRLLFEPLL